MIGKLKLTLQEYAVRIEELEERVFEYECAV